MNVNLSEIPGAFHLPRPNWQVIRAWVEEHVPEPQRPKAWAQIADQWLETLDTALGGGYRLEQSGNLMMFAPRDHEHASALLTFAETALAEITSKLGEVAGENWLGPLAILLFPDEKTYYSYVSQFYPNEGDFGGSSGICLTSDGYVHIVLQQASAANLERTIVHELTHACLRHLDLPAWVNEGIAQLAEGRGGRGSHLDSETTEEMREHWRERGLQDFWWDKSFHSPDEEQRWSYDLAWVLIQLILADYPGRLPQFVRHARYEDAGDSSTRDHLGVTVADLAARFLGEGPWEPVPPDVAAYCRRASHYVSRGEYGRAIADCDEVIRLDPECADAFTTRALAREQIGEYALVVGDAEEAVRLRPDDPTPCDCLAWILATCPHDEYRDGERAVELATTACKLTGYDSWSPLNTLAAAYAETGDFEEARNWAKEALRRAPPEERDACKERLRLYKQEEPYRDLSEARPNRQPSPQHDRMIGES